ncbi:MAG: cupin domain-containing protein [Bacteroidota bacterium]
MKTTVINKQNSRKYTWGGTCESFVLLDTPGLSVKHEVMPPATKEKPHYHNEAKQLFYILRGQATFHVNGETVIACENESVYILPRQIHFVENQSPAAIEFLVISQPATDEDRVNTE